jgi:hypothetical protein
MVTSLPRRWVNAAVVFVQERIVSRHARETGQSRETIYRNARSVRHELEEGQRMRKELERRTQELEAENARLRKIADTNPFEDPDKVAQFAAMAQAEGVSLPVARRLLTILQAKPARRR